jgi:hypothetical protein
MRESRAWKSDNHGAHVSNFIRQASLRDSNMDQATQSIPAFFSCHLFSSLHCPLYAFWYGLWKKKFLLPKFIELGLRSYLLSHLEPLRATLSCLFYRAPPSFTPKTDLIGFQKPGGRWKKTNIELCDVWLQLVLLQIYASYIIHSSIARKKRNHFYGNFFSCFLSLIKILKKKTQFQIIMGRQIYIYIYIYSAKLLDIGPPPPSFFSPFLPFSLLCPICTTCQQL